MLRFLLLIAATIHLYGQNQTSYVTYPLPQDSLPFRVNIQFANFSLPFGLQAYVPAQYKGEWLLISGRVYGMHGFDQNLAETFPVSGQNSSVIVVNPKTGQSFRRSLYDPTSQLTQAQIDQISVTDALAYQTEDEKTLYFVGGYGTNTATGQKQTMSVLTAIDVPSLIKWVKREPNCKSAAKCLRQVSDPLLQVTGGVMLQTNPHEPYLLGLGQNFVGTYVDTTSNGIYTHQIRPFQIIDTGKSLFVQPYSQPAPIASYRRRDLNIIPIIKKQGKAYRQAFVALGGVFTPGINFGAWTIPIEINGDGSSSTIDPNANPGTFAQGMNNYNSATAGLYSKKTNDMYTLLFGGISFLYSVNGGFYSPGGSFALDPELPYVNDVTTLRIDSSGNYQQYFMSGTFPQVTPSFGTAPGPDLLFGSLSSFFPADGLPLFANGVIDLDQIQLPLLLGYIVGGIESSMAETDSEIGNVDTHASSYIFTVTLEAP